MKSALITGAASGIGRACAERMAREGYGVVIADVNLPAAQDLAGQLTGEGLSAIAIHMDVSSEEEVEAGFDRMMEAYGSCDLVMSNAGVQIVHPFEDYPFADWRKMMAIHADGAFLVSRAAYRRMKTSGRGGRSLTTSSSTVLPDLPSPSPGRVLNTASIPTSSAPALSRHPWWKSRSRSKQPPWASPKKRS